MKLIFLFISAITFIFLNISNAQTSTQADALYKYAQQEDARRQAETIDKINNNIKGIPESRAWKSEDFGPVKVIFFIGLIISIVHVLIGWNWIDKIFFPEKNHRAEMLREEELKPDFDQSKFNEAIESIPKVELNQMELDDIKQRMNYEYRYDWDYEKKIKDFMVKNDLICEDFNMPLLRSKIVSMKKSKIKEMTMEEIREEVGANDEYEINIILKEKNIKCQDGPFAS